MQVPHPQKREEINEWIGPFCCLFAIFCLPWNWVMWRRTLQKCMLIVWARSMGLTYFLWFSSWTATAAHVKQPNVFHSFWLWKKKLVWMCSFSQSISRKCITIYFFYRVKKKMFYITLEFTGFMLIMNYQLCCRITDGPRGLDPLTFFSHLKFVLFSSPACVFHPHRAFVESVFRKWTEKAAMKFLRG